MSTQGHDALATDFVMSAVLAGVNRDVDVQPVHNDQFELRLIDGTVILVTVEDIT